jgi:uncharacterized membrane protein
MDLTKHLKKKFLTGLFVLIPLLVTIYIIYLVISFVDTIIAPTIQNITLYFTGKEIYIPGTGLFLFAVVAYATGILATNYIGKRLLSYGYDRLILLREETFLQGGCPCRIPLQRKVCDWFCDKSNKKPVP